MAGMGKMEQGFDGTVGWTKNPMMGTQLLEGRTLDELRRSSDFYKDIDPSKLWKSATTKGVTTFINLPCYEVAVEGDMGNGSLFYGVDDGLARGMRMTVDTPMGKVPTTTSMVEYKDFDGLKIASKTEIEAMGAKQVMTVDSVDFTPVVPLEGKVEIYLQTVLDAQRDALRDTLKGSLKRRPTQDRTTWLMNKEGAEKRPSDPAQISLLVSGMDYVTGLEKALDATEAGEAATEAPTPEGTAEGTADADDAAADDAVPATSRTVTVPVVTITGADLVRLSHAVALRRT
jgi:hypothetical protein